MLKLYKPSSSLNKVWLKNAFTLLFLVVSLHTAKAQTTCQAGFTYTIANNEVSFINTSTNSANNPMKYFWNFGDAPENFSVENPTHYYSSNGKYVVTLAALDTGTNCYSVYKDTIDYKFDFNATCNAQFTHSIKPYTLEVTFTMSHWVSRDKKRTWIFGDGDTSKNDTAWNVKKHTYSAYGTYNACLVIADSAKKCVDTFCYSFSIQKPADLDSCKGYFTYDINVNQIGFRSYINCGKWTPNSYYWDFGDGDTSTLKKPVHKYKTHGVYDVTLIVDGTGGAIANTFKEKVYLQNFCEPKIHSIYTKDFDLTMNIYLNQDDQFVIDFGDGTSANQLNKDSNITHHYILPGKYRVKFLKTNAKLGCKDSTYYDIIIKEPVWCKAVFSVSENSHTTRTITASTGKLDFTGADSSLFQWDLGDGDTLTGIGKYYVSHRYKKDGNYKIKLKVSNAAHNCVDTFSSMMTIYTEPAIINVSVRIDANTYADSAYIYLIQGDDSVNHTLTAIGTGIIVNKAGEKNEYTFTNFPPGKYTLKAALSKNSKYFKVFFPTYSTSVLKWNEAEGVYISELYNKKHADIILKLGLNPGGPGFIGGKISAGANKKEGDPLKDIQVMLFNADKEPV
ncbi:MAG: PKD domain-containing protein, partial [Bacteroidia bacterium]